MMNEDKKCQGSYSQTKSDIKKWILENKELATQLSSAQNVLFQSNRNLSKDQAYLEKMGLKEAELRKDN